jgi:hypothetical protein
MKDTLTAHLCIAPLGQRDKKTMLSTHAMPLRGHNWLKYYFEKNNCYYRNEKENLTVLCCFLEAVRG